LFQPGPARGVPGVVSPNDYPFAFAQNAAFQALKLWVEIGLPPAHVPFIDVDTTTVPARIVRDSSGNATGGLRTPFVDVPVTSYTPFDTVAHVTASSGFCILYGFNTPFDDAQLASLYRNDVDYDVKFALDALRLVKERLWLLPDAGAAIGRALEVKIP